MRRFVVIGRTATASPTFSLLDPAGTSGRLDVLLRCVRAALLFSHGVRKDVVVYLVLHGGPRAPRTLRFDGSGVRFLRPDERNLSVLVQKALAEEASGPAFVEVRFGIFVADGGLEVVRPELGSCTKLLLEAGAPDVRDAAFEPGDVAVFLGDHLGLDAETRAELVGWGAMPVGLGPVGVHSDDAIAIANNELDRRVARAAASEAT